MTDDREALLVAWVDEVCAALDLAAPPTDIDTVLALAGRVAHGVVRPAAPLTTFLAGYAAGRRAGNAEQASAGIDPELAVIDRLLAERAAVSRS